MSTTVSINIGAIIATSKITSVRLAWHLGARTTARMRGVDLDGSWLPETFEAVDIRSGGPIIWIGSVDEVKVSFPASGAREYEIICTGYEQHLDKHQLVNANLSMVPVAANAAGDSLEILIPSNPFQLNEAVWVRSAGTVAGGLAAGTTYYVSARTSTHVQLSATLGGAAVDITTIGSGQHHLMWCAGEIARKIAFPLGEGITEGLIRPGVGIESFAPEHSDVWSLIDSLAKASDYVAYIEPTAGGAAKFYFVPKTEFSAPFDLDEAEPEETQPVLHDPAMSVRRTREIYANRVRVVPNDLLWPLASLNIIGDGVRSVWDIGAPVKSILSITRGGVKQTVGNLGDAGSQYYLQPLSPYLYQDGAEPVLGSGEVLTVQYFVVGANYLQAEDVGEQGSRGLFEKTVKTEIVSYGDANTAAAAELANAKALGLVLEYGTKTPGLRPGQRQMVTWPSAGITTATAFVLDQVDADWEEQGDFRYTVQANAGARIPGTVEVFRSLGGTTASGAVGGSATSATAAVELIHSQEITLVDPSTVVGAAVAPSVGHALYVFLTQDGTGGREITWGADFASSTPTQVNGDALSVTRCHFIALSDSKWHIVSFSRLA